MSGKKFDSEKPDWSLLDLSTVEQMATVLTYGSVKYSRHNYDKVEPYRYLAALLRHITRWQQGEKLDEESGLHHLAHAMCNIMFLLWKERNKNNGKESCTQSTGDYTVSYTIE